MYSHDPYIRNNCNDCDFAEDDLDTHMATLRSTFGRYNKKVKEGTLEKPTYRQKFVLNNFKFLEPYIIPRSYKKEETDGEEEPTESAEHKKQLGQAYEQVNYVNIATILSRSYHKKCPRLGITAVVEILYKKKQMELI